MLTPDQFLLGVGLTVLLAVGSQILAHRLRIPALILLLPAGFTAGALTDVVHPDKLAPANFSSIVSLCVAVILYDAGLGLELRHLREATRSVVLRLLVLGLLITWASVMGLGPALFGIPLSAAVMLGAILVVSGPTVVGPLLEHVRPSERVRRILVWEGTLIDPVGAILGALVFHSLVAGEFQVGHGFRFGEFLLSGAVGLAGGAVGAGLLWFCLHTLRLGETLGTLAQLATVIVVSAGCDILREDTGLIAAVVAGLAVANLPGLDMPARLPFFEILVQLIIGLLFVSISAGVAPSSVRPVLLPSLLLIAVLVLVVRPLVAWLSTGGSGLSTGERAFLGWMAPRGIVAASTASAFSATLAEKGLAGASKILPVTFLVIVGTVALYGLTAAPVAGRLGVTRPARARPLVVGGEPWAADLGRCLRSAGVDVVLWRGPDEQWERFEGVTSVLLLTGDDDFDALVSVLLRDRVDGPVQRIAHDLADRWERGERFLLNAPGTPVPAGYDVQLVVRADGRLDAVTPSRTVERGAGDAAVLLGPAAGR
ncbi:cation:proton antiporter [Streptomyces sp. NPDC007861]|uniref:cation:proton antiporter domain-containing protein n=1 Tax=Streptomyces sp. NPDC007861 TaxID=3154893 RepID=UPI00340666D6